MKGLKFLLILILGIMLVSACTPVPADMDNAVLILVGLESQPVELNISEILAMSAVTGTAVSISSSGSETEVIFKGISLDSVLALYGHERTSFNSLIINAGDGYSVEIPPQVWEERAIILAFEINGEPLSDKDKPFRVIIPGERALYWVRAVAELQFVAEVGPVSVNELSFFEDSLDSLATEVYTYYGSEDSAVNIRGIAEGQTKLILIAKDGLLKHENLMADVDYFIKYTGEDSPLFISPAIPKGMYVKDLGVLIAGNKAIIFGQTFVNDNQINMAKVLALLNPYLGEGQISLTLKDGKLTLPRNELGALVLRHTLEGVYNE